MALLTQVRVIVRELGVGGVSIREVARRAKVSHAAPAHHFRNKAGIFTAFATEGFRRLAEAVDSHVRDSRSSMPPDILAAMGRAYIRFALDNPEHFAVMFSPEAVEWQDPEYVESTRAAFRPFVDLLKRAGREGYLTEEPVIVGSAAWSLVHGFSALWLGGRIKTREGMADPGEMADRIARLFATSALHARPDRVGTTGPEPRRKARR